MPFALTVKSDRKLLHQIPSLSQQNTVLAELTDTMYGR